MWCLQGAFLDAEAVNKTSSNLSADDLLELLNTDQAKGDKAQSGVVSDKVIRRTAYCYSECSCFMISLVRFLTR